MPWTMTPDEAAKAIAAAFPELPEARRAELEAKIVEAMQDWGNLTASVEAESGPR